MTVCWTSKILFRWPFPRYFMVNSLPAQSFACFHVYDLLLLLQQPPEQSHWWAGPLVHFTALSECDSRDLELPLAPVCKYVTIMIRIDDRTLWFHCLARGTGGEICWIWTFVWFWHQRWYVGKWVSFFAAGFPPSTFVCNRSARGSMGATILGSGNHRFEGKV